MINMHAHRDASLEAVRRWKAAAPGRRAVGVMPVYAPREILHAAGVLPVGLRGFGELEIVRGDAFYQSYICHLPRSIVEMALGPGRGVLDGLICPAICDVIRNLSGVWKMEFPDDFVNYLDVPQNFDPEVGGRFYRGELEHLRVSMERLADRPLCDADLHVSIAHYNRNRALVRELYARRVEEPWRIPTDELFSIVREGDVLPVEEHNAALDDYRREIETRDTRPLDNVRVVLVGAFCEQPPLGLLKTLGRAGCYVVDDDLCLGSRWFDRDVAVHGDPIAALVDAYLNASTWSSLRYEAGVPKGPQLVERVRACRADGVIFCAPSFCDPALLDQPMYQKALAGAGIPFSTIKYAENTGQFHAMKEQAGTFADSIRLWGDA